MTEDDVLRPVEILLVDDDPEDCRRFRELLRWVPLPPVVTEADGLTAAVESFRRRPADVVLLDLMLPESRGLATVRAMRAATPEAPIVVLTGADGLDLLAIREGASDYLVKDRVDADSLARAVRYSIERRRVERELSAAHRRSAAIFAHATSAFLLADSEGRFVDANPAAVELLGWSREELLDRRVFETAGRGERAEMERRWGALLAEGRYSGEVRLRRRDGAPVIADCRAARDVQPGIHLLVLTDVGPRKRAEEALNARVGQQAAVAELGRRAAGGLPLDRLLLEAVQLLARTLDADRASIVEREADGSLVLRAGIGCPPDAEVSVDDCPVTALARTVLSDRRPFFRPDVSSDPAFAAQGVRTVIAAPIGETDPPCGALTAGARRAEPFGEDDLHFVASVANVVGSAWDRARSERSLAEQETLFRTVAENLAEGLFITSLSGRIRYVNPAFCELTGYTEAEAVGADALELLVPPEERREVRSRIRQRAGGIAGAHEAELLRRDGRRFFASVHAAPMPGPDGRPIAMVTGITDVTARREAEARAAHAERLESVGRLAGGVAHDFNNLLTAITGYSRLLLRRLEGTDRDRVQEIQRAADRAAMLTRQLLAYSRRQILRPERLSLNRVVADLDGPLRRLVGPDVDVVVSAAAEPAEVRADPGQIEQVLLNLVSNSRAAMPRGGLIEIEIRSERPPAALFPDGEGPESEDCVLLSIRDDGAGMDADTLSRIFEPFFTTKGRTEATGLGMSMVYGIVRQSGGAILVESRPGEGTLVRIWLPRAEAPAPAARPSGSRLPAGPGETILVAEDEPAVRSMLVEILSAAGYRVLSAGGADEALALLMSERGRVDVLLTDVVMPDRDGGSLAVEATAIAPSMRVFYMSGYTENVVASQGFLGPSARFLQKPFSPEALLAALRADGQPA